MATLKTDVVIVGVGAVGGIVAAELAKSGMKVIGLERGPRLTTQDFSGLDELRYFQRQELRPNIKKAAGYLAAGRQNGCEAAADLELRQSGRRRDGSLRRSFLAPPRR